MHIHVNYMGVNFYETNQEKLDKATNIYIICCVTATLHSRVVTAPL